MATEELYSDKKIAKMKEKIKTYSDKDLCERFDNYQEGCETYRVCATNCTIKMAVISTEMRRRKKEGTAGSDGTLTEANRLNWHLNDGGDGL